jgi:hypothetical protein
MEPFFSNTALNKSTPFGHNFDTKQEINDTVITKHLFVFAKNSTSFILVGQGHSALEMTAHINQTLQDDRSYCRLCRV